MSATEPSALNENRGSRQQAWAEASSSPTDIQWQWMHKSGWRDYDLQSNIRIEAAYQDGRNFVLVKSGKEGKAPMGIFFNDMLQHDANSGNKRQVQRLGPEPCMQKLGRRFLWLLRSAEKANYLQSNFLEFEAEQDPFAAADLAPKSDPFYKHGCFGPIARSPMFLALSAFVIILNAIWLGVDAQNNKAHTLYQADWGFVFVENLFCAYFFCEILIRYLAFVVKRDCLRDAWFVLDAVLLAFMLGEIWIIPLYFKITSGGNTEGGAGWAVLRIANVLKIVRLGRLARIIRHWPEMFAMCKAIVYALRSTFLTVLLLAILTYVFSIIFITQLRNHQEVIEELPDFKTIHGTMWLLTIEGVLLDGPKDTLNILVQYTYVLTAVFLTFIGISAFTLMNMLIGIICNVVDEVRIQAREDSDVNYLKNTMLEILVCHDDDNDRAIREDEFKVLMRNPAVCLILSRFGVDVDDLKSMQSNFFGEIDKQFAEHEGMTFGHEETTKQRASLTFSEFLRTILRLRQNNSVKVTDVVDLREFIQKGMEFHREFVDQRFRNLESSIQESFASSAGSIEQRPNFIASLRSAASVEQRPTPIEKIPKEENKPTIEEPQIPGLGQQILNWRGATRPSIGSTVREESRTSIVHEESHTHAGESPGWQEACSGLENLLMRVQAEILQKESVLEQEVQLSRDQLSDIQKQLDQVCRQLGPGQLAGSLKGLRTTPQPTSHPWHTAEVQRTHNTAILSPFAREEVSLISADDVEV